MTIHGGGGGPAPKFEYKIIEAPIGGYLALNKAGAQGWELVAVVAIGAEAWFYLKRPK